MVKRSQDVTVKRSKSSKTYARAAQPGDDRGVHLGGREKGQRRRSVSTGRDQPESILPLAPEVQRGWRSGVEEHEARETACDRSGDGRNDKREPAAQGHIGRSFDRASASEKKRELGLHGPLKGRHLAKEVREEILVQIDRAVAEGESLEAVCGVLEINPRAVYRWKSGVTASENHGGGGGRNRITPLEEKRVVALAKKFPRWRCRRLAYELERTAKVFIGKTKVAEILKAHGLNHAFERRPKRPSDIPADMLLHEPWKPNLLWGTDWSWVRVAERFYFLLIVVDWYSRKIISWGLFEQITKFEVVAVVTDAVAIEGLDKLPPDALKPIVVADHGSANTAAYTRENIEIQGLELWLSGIGRPTGNARTERTFGTLKREEINLQETYENGTEAMNKIGTAIWDYNYRRPNEGNGGFAPNSVHHQGRHALTKRRKESRQFTENRRRNHWSQDQPC